MLLRLYASLVPVHDVWRLTDLDSFFDLMKSLIILPVNYICTFAPYKSMKRLALAIWSVTALLLKQVLDDFRCDWVPS